MSDKTCQKCMRLNKQGNAVLWCIQCKEECCEQCVIYHKAFKNYENHKFLDLAEYHLICPLLVDINETCTEHDEQIEYFCHGHDVACCRYCKEKDHSLCNEKIVDLKTNAENDNANMDQIFDIIEKVDKNRSDNLENLDKSQKEIVDKLQKQKKYLQDVIQNIEEKQRLFASQFNSRREEIATLRQSLVEKRTILKENQKLEKILNKMKSEDIFYVLSARKFAKLNENEHKHIIIEVEKLSNIKCDYDIRLSIGEDKIPSLKADVAFNLSPCNILQDLDNPDFSSSTVEDEQVLQQNESNKNDFADDALFNITGKILENDLPPTKETQFRLVTKLNVERSTGQTNIRCANMLLSGEIIFGEISNPRLMIYKRLGYLNGAARVGELTVTCGPLSLDIIDNLTVAYTTGNYIEIVKIDKENKYAMQRIEQIKLDDYCHGLAYTNYKIIANCEKSGMQVLSLKGEIMFANPNLTGRMNICAGKNDEIFFVRRGQRKVFSTFTSDANSIKNVCFTEQCSTLLGANGIATDESGLLYVSCDNSYKIYSGGRHTLLKPQNDILHAPLNIAYNTQYKSLIVVNKDGKGISVFQKTLGDLNQWQPS